MCPRTLMTFAGARRLFVGSALAFILATAQAMAVESEPIQITSRWRVVGIISSAGGGKNKSENVAVLRDRESQRTYPVAVGDTLPQMGGARLVTIEGHRVSVIVDGLTIELSFTDADEDNTAAPAVEASQGNNARYLESYYRGFTDEAPPVFEAYEPVEAERDTNAFGENSGAAAGRSGPTYGGSYATSFSGFKDDGRWHYDLYRRGDATLAGHGDYDGDDDGDGDGDVPRWSSAPRLTTLPSVPSIPLLPPLINSRGPDDDRSGGEDGSGDLGH